MQDISKPRHTAPVASTFFDRPDVHMEEVPIGPGIPLGIEQVSNAALGIGGAYGTWGEGYDNEALPDLIEQRVGASLEEGERLNLGELGFTCRHHIPDLSDQQHLDLEVAAGAAFLRAAAHASGWEPEEVEGLLVGMTAPVCDDYTLRIARAAGIPDRALKLSVHKACDSSVAALNLALNPALSTGGLGVNVAEQLRGKKVLLGGIEGLSRVMSSARDKQALQLFGTGAGMIGVIPGQTMRFLVGGTHEAYDEEGVLQVRMHYPHSGRRAENGSMTEITRVGDNHIRVAGLMHEPADRNAPVVMAGPMGMVKLFVRTGVSVVRTVYHSYQGRMTQAGMPGKEIAVAIVHHANLKINQLKEKNLQREGICMPMPWLLSEFGNVCAASNMIAFLRQLRSLKAGSHILVDGFGAGTHYDVLALEVGA